ncbi:parallel beta helix pectate lyase-like protein [Prosthecobacter fusiformis]|uniref:Parallel beta helix pectate lyase-like protein n=1 Tax=Prosthecobacter fusiformis TaxID=48464 RepID=A0A4R7RM66_9BACT|nr:right-handed parallel beta-helix repeat-containing protein [Prosthecobacter fusiformis]TDU64044.1 parallel beta helix pectate lyase-like protein [Prosthecobacter fusiformis]
MLRVLLLIAFSAVLAAAQTNVQTVGVKGDGQTDDTVALQKAVDEYGSLLFPKGTYKLTQTITVDLSKTGLVGLSGDGTARFLMTGAGPAFRLIGHHEGSAAPTQMKPEIWEQERTPMLSGFEIYGAHPEADGVEVGGAMQVTLHRLVVSKCRHAIHLTTRNRNVMISDCHLYDNTGIGVFLDNVNLHQINIVGSHISYNRGGGVVSRGGNVRNLHIGTCDIESNHYADSPPSANVELDSTGGSIGEVAITGCTLQHTSKAAGSANIRILGAGTDASLERRVGRAHTREGNVTISANVFSDVKVNIEVKDARGVVITGNTFWEGFEHDLLAENCEHLIVSSNNFDRNPRYLVNGFKEAENNGIVFKTCTDSSFSGNIVAGVMRKRAAVEIVGGRRLMITGNSILDSDGAGLLLEQVEQSLISDNLIRDDRVEDVRSKEPSLLILGGNDNQVGANLLGNGKQVR